VIKVALQARLAAVKKLAHAGDQALSAPNPSGGCDARRVSTFRSVNAPKSKT
jgi:hypothetical protein